MHRSAASPKSKVEKEEERKLQPQKDPANRHNLRKHPLKKVCSALFSFHSLTLSMVPAATNGGS